MGKYFEVNVDKEDNRITLNAQELTPWGLQSWIMDMIRLNTVETLEVIFKDWKLFEFAEDWEDEEEGHIEYVWCDSVGENNYYVYFVYADDDEDAKAFLMNHIARIGLPDNLENRR